MGVSQSKSTLMVIITWKIPDDLYDFFNRVYMIKIQVALICNYCFESSKQKELQTKCIAGLLEDIGHLITI